jgi:hypothetical protein
MKKIIIVSLVAVLTLCMASMAFATIVGSKHDLGTGGSGAFSQGRLGSNSGQVCVFCHHPHRGNPAGKTANATDALLWNLDDLSSNATFTKYSNPSMNATTVDVDTAAPQSFLCMACHDGYVAANSLVQLPGDGSDNTAMNLGTIAANLGTTLADDHPVNFTWLGWAGAIATNTANNVVAGSNTYPLFAGKMQCGTCHDVHAGDTSKDSVIQFLRGSTGGSQICVDCHINK